MDGSELEQDEKPNPFGFLPGASPLDTWRARSFPDLRPIDFIGGERERCLNLLVPEFHRNIIDGRTERAVVFACAVCAKARCGLRLITLDGPCQPDFFGMMMEGRPEARPETVEFFDGSVRHTSDTYRRLVVDVGDLFMATDWASARMARFLGLRDKFVLLLQRVESDLYPAGDERRLVFEAFRPSDFLPVFSSKELLEDLVEEGLMPPQDDPLFLPRRNGSQEPQTEAAGGDGGEKRLWVEASSGCWPLLALEAVDMAVRAGVLSTDEWRIFLPWQGRLPAFCDGGRAEKPEADDFLSRRDFLRTIDLGIFLGAGAADHPSVDEIRAAGGTVVAGPLSDRNEVFRGISRAAVGEVSPGERNSAAERAVEEVASFLEGRTKNGDSA